MRVLKYHEKKLLRKVDLLEWKGTSTQKEHAITRKYVIEERETYVKYNLIVGKIKRLALALAKLNDNDQVKIEMAKELSNKLYSLGIVPAKTLLECSKVSVASFCKRRLSSVMADIQLVPSITTAVTFIKHGHVKVGTKIVADPSLLVSRSMEDYVTWSNHSKVKRIIEEFAEE
ncbi:U3 small nucleolar ribonucleoprotein IMP3 [Nematocida sp. LUAm3]|nr:U3 small nucleolar ribonucleoprotein IMP3 [Nematocida sp. LUAm3]KAI5174727.1 U3 small nucleolar ribonucleoprotein IMP3 [Nematocida sp. LUAm2]KAI5177862.1 U3 small nucleolar ribonucleoprotein IMP3 [Nematocida sp. LUAm1]